MNADHKPQKKLIFGCSGSGKSTMFHKLIQTGGYKYRYIFDWDLKVAHALGWQAATSVEGLCRLQDSGRPILFYPKKMFSDLEEAFGFFCRFVLVQSETRQGKKLFGADECQEFITTNFSRFPVAFKEMLNYGRNLEIDLVLAAQRITDMNNRTRGQLTEIFVFKHADTDVRAFDELSKIGIDPEAVKALPHPSISGKVGWIYRHCLTGRMETISHEIKPA